MEMPKGEKWLKEIISAGQQDNSGHERRRIHDIFLEDQIASHTSDQIR